MRLPRLIASCAVVGTILAALSAPMSAQTPPGDKRIGHHTLSEWRAMIDTLWGMGLPTSDKLQVFDTFWNMINQEYAGFPYLNLDWDSVKTMYRPEIEAGVSRGRLAAIMGQLSLALQEIHTYANDGGIAGAGFYYPGAYATHTSYAPGVPVVWPSGWGPSGIFGAALTPLQDSTLLVYKALEQHPLGLSPGDIVVGYDGTPWKEMYQDVFSAGFVLGYMFEGRYGSSGRSMTHSLLGSAGNNWGLFDTVEVIKYSSGDTVHLSTAPLSGLSWGSVFGTEQMQIPGVRMPNNGAGELLSYGVIENTSIGYVYVYAWRAQQSDPFASAINDLVNIRKVSGLILDFRFNLGSDNSITAANAGLDYLFSENPGGKDRWQAAMRLPGDRDNFSYSIPYDQSVSMSPNYYDRPIAVLTGPQSWSFGDLNAFEMRSHPMVRFFGLPTNGAFAVPNSPTYTGPLFGSWNFGRVKGQMYSLYGNEGFLTHRCFPVDEEVWLTPDGVAAGEDDVVKRAVEWINSVSYSHDFELSQNLGVSGQDTLRIVSRLENPLGHAVGTWAYTVDRSGVPIDSCMLVDDGNHADGIASDSVYGGCMLFPPAESSFRITMSTVDSTDGSRREHPGLHRIFTNGPVKCAGWMEVYSDTIANPGDILRIKVRLVNEGSADTVRSVVAKVTALDTLLYIGSSISVTFGNLIPGQPSTGPASQMLLVKTTSPDSAVARLLVAISSEGYPLWTDTLTMMVLDPSVGVVGVATLPTKFDLEQNYPNPFNPETKIRYQIPEDRRVRLSIFDLLGREVSVLVDEDQEAGVHSATWDASGFPSSVYFCRLTAGTATLTRRLVLLR